MPNPAEVATLVVRGLTFTAWESVWVQHRVAEDAPLFRFTSTEEDYPRWQTLRFKPGEECAIYLGGQLAMIGVITTRQVAYDANSHGVMLMGKGLTWLAARASVITKEMTFDNKTFTQVAFEVLAPFDYIKPQVIGVIDETPFKRLRAPVGVTVWGWLEELARTRGVILGSDHTGGFLLIGKHSFQADNSLVEGRNILKAQIIIDRQRVYSDYIMRNQGAADDKDNMAKQAHQEAGVPSQIPPIRYSPLLNAMEYPAWTVAEVRQRAEYERQWNDGATLTANITVQGWHQPSGRLWKQGAKYYVETPMGLLQQDLKAKTVTFSQDRNSGTLTELEMVHPNWLNDTSDIQFSEKFKLDVEEFAPTTFSSRFPETL
jgi:prophage tail gpP-like protein